MALHMNLDYVGCKKERKKKQTKNKPTKRKHRKKQWKKDLQ